jgi:tRNA pseudouridine synthase 10
MIRDKTIHKIAIIPINTNYALVFILASAGTYIKEFIHSDL